MQCLLASLKPSFMQSSLRDSSESVLKCNAKDFANLIQMGGKKK